MREDRSEKMISIRYDLSIRSEVYEQEIIRSVPNYHLMLESAVGSLPLESKATFRVVDLGAGTFRLITSDLNVIDQIVGMM